MGRLQLLIVLVSSILEDGSVAFQLQEVLDETQGPPRPFARPFTGNQAHELQDQQGLSMKKNSLERILESSRVFDVLMISFDGEYIEKKEEDYALLINS